ncbi:MAG: hypothetical protein KC933_28450 [Myxococcales bacterium]|nr:hypothetical protein [Myxococcales bacterium]MCB9645521.1 hypothetical protein [Deltaproteobacteria bacterium]
MRHPKALLTAGLFALTLAAAPGAAEAKGDKLLLQDLVAEGVEAHEASAISTAACNALSKADKHEVLCGDDLRNMMRFGALAASFDQCADDACYAGMAKALQARFVVSGKVSRLGKVYVLSLSMFDTTTNKPSGRAEIKASTIEQLHLDTPEAVSALLSKR